MLVSSSCPDPAVVTLPKPEVPATLLGSWQAVHDRLAVDLARANPAGGAVYAYCVHQAFGTAATRIWAQQRAARLAAQPWPEPGRRWTLPQLDQACALAWLAAHFSAAGLPPICAAGQLAEFDCQLFQQAQAALADFQPRARGLLVRVIRYLTLRLPAATAARYLPLLVAQWPQMPPEEPVLLGLDGSAAELGALLRLYQAGLHHPTLQARLRQGIQELLASRRAVDFQQQHYAIFPYERAIPGHAARFSAELTWERGDLVQSWVLYEAQAVLRDTELAHIAELVGLSTLLRTSEPATTITSGWFYDGAAGVAQRYAQLYHASGLPAFRAAYQTWLSRTQELVPSLVATAPAVLNPTTERGCLSELVGVGLVLLAAVKSLKVDWEALAT